MLPPTGSQSASQSQSQSIQTTHTFILQAYTQGRPASPDGELKFQMFTEPTLLCHVTEHTTTASQGLSELRLGVEWALPSSSQTASSKSTQMPGPTEEGKMTLESLNLCAFAEIDSSQSSISSAKRKEAPLKGAHKGEVVAIRYRWPLKSEGSSRRLQLKFATVEDATAFVSLIQNVCPISTKQEKANTSKQAPSAQASQDRSQEVRRPSEDCSSAKEIELRLPAGGPAIISLANTASKSPSPPAQACVTPAQTAPAECAVITEEPAPPKPSKDDLSTSAPSQVATKKQVKKRAAPRSGPGKGRVTAAPKKRVKPNVAKESVAHDFPSLPVRPETSTEVVTSVPRITLPHLNVSPIAEPSVTGSQPPRYSLYFKPWLPSPPLKRNVILASDGFRGQDTAYHLQRAAEQQIRRGPPRQPLQRPATVPAAHDLDVVLAGLCAKDREELLDQTASILKSPFFSVLVENMEKSA